MYNPQELQRKAQLNLHGIDNYAKTTIEKNEAPKKEKNIFATIGNFFTNIVEGAVKSLEGIVDAGAMLVGLFGADVDDFVSYDFTSDLFGKDADGEGLFDWSWGKDLEESSLLDDNHWLNQIAEGVGGMLPTVAVGFATGGASLAGTAAATGAKAASIGAKIAQTGTFVASAMGNASESALKEGASYEQALGYGALSGAAEGVIESVSGGIAGTKMGTVLGKQIAKKTGTKLATTFISEGLEEVASDLLDPEIQRLTGVNKDAKVDTNNLFKTFVVGGSVGAVMGSAGRKFKAISNSEIGGEKFLKIADEVSEIEYIINHKENILGSSNKTQIDIDKVSVKVADDIGYSLQKISNNLKTMSEEQRLGALQVINSENSIINNLFDSNGSIKPGVLEDVELSKTRNYSANSILKSQEIKDELNNLNKSKGWNLQVDNSHITEQERKKLAQFYAVRNGLSEKSGENLTFVVVSGKGANRLDGFYSPNNKTIYISRDTLSDSLKEISKNALYQTTIHETDHFVDNEHLQKYLINYAQNDNTLFDETINSLMKKGYGFTRHDIENAIQNKGIGVKLNQSEELAYSELSASLAAKLLGNEDFVKRLARSNRGLFNKIKNFISDKISSGKKSEAYRTVEYLFDNALKEIKEKDVEERENNNVKDRNKQNEKLDNKPILAYNFSKKGYAERDPKTVTEKEFKHHYWASANNLLTKEEFGVLDSAVGNISRGEVYNKNSDGFFMIPVGEKGILNKIIFTDGKKGSYSINSIIEIACDNETDLTDIRSVVYARERNGIHTENSDLFKIYYSKDFRYNDFVAKIQNYSQDSNREQDGTRSDREVEFSLKDSGEIRYSFKGNKTARYINKKIDTPTLSFIRNELRKLYVPINSAIADGIAIEKDNTIFVVDSGMEDGRVEFGVREKITISDENLRKVKLEKINDRAISKGYVSIEISRRIKHSSDNDSNSSIGRELSKELSDNTRKSENNESRIFEKDATDGSRRLKFSLKDELKYFGEVKIEDEKEYQRLKKELKRRNGNHPSEIDWAITDRYLYIVKNNTSESFTPVVQIDCIKHEQLFMRLIRMIDYENYSSEKTIEKWLDEIYSHPDFFNWTNDNSVSASQNEEIAITSDNNQVSLYKEIDSKGRKLSDEQIEFFKDSKVRDRYGRLKEVYHGTYGEFYTFDKALLGTNFGGDAKLGFFFTASKALAEDYSINAKEHKRFNIIQKVADGNDDILNFLSNNNNLNNYDAIKNIIDKDSYDEIRDIDNALAENLNDIYDVYLNIENPYVENWERKAHYKLDMIRAITKAKSNGHDGVIIKRVDASVIEPRSASDLYVVFEPNQIKLTTNKKPTKNPDMRFSLKDNADVNQYTEKQYNDFGWARVNGVLSANENYDFKDKYAKLKNGTSKDIHKTLSGEFIVAVNNIKEKYFGVNNVLVYAKGPVDNYKISKIIRIHLDNETAIELVRDTIYDYETNRRKQAYTASEIVEAYFGKELISEFRLGDFANYQESKAERQGQASRDDGFRNYEYNQREFDGRRNIEKNTYGNSRGIKLSLKDSDGNTLTTGQQKFFKDSKARDSEGNLQVLYHGTEGEFFTFDKTLRGKVTGANDAKLGFFFTTNKDVALEYAVNAFDNKFAYLKNKIANGDHEILYTLTKVGGYKALAATEDVKEFGRLEEKGENFDHDIYKVYLNLTNPYVKDWQNKPYEKQQVLKLIDKALQSDYDGVIIKNIDDSFSLQGTISDVYVAFESNQIKLTTNKNPTSLDDIRFSKKITADMTDHERFDIIKNKKIENIPIAKELTKEQLDNIQRITSFEDLNKYFGAEKRSIIKKIASEFGVFKEFYNKDIELSFNFSNRGFEESYSKQKHNFVSYAKMFSVFDDVVENAVGIEVHNRNIENYKKDQTLSNVYVLASAFIDKESIVPVKLEVKEFSDKKNTLYVAIALESIKKDGVSEQEVAKGVAQQYSHPSTISISDLLKNVNPNDKDFYKYIPKQFFDENSETIKFSLKNNATYTLSDGQVKKKLADYTKLKYYSKVESERTINSILETHFTFEDYDVKLSGKTKAEVVDILWQGFNTLEPGRRTRLASKIADYIIDNAIMENIYHDVDNQVYLDTITFLKPYLHSVDLSAIKDDIKYRYDTNNSVFALWGKGDRQGYTADQIAQQLHEKGFNINAEREADIFFEIATAYSEAVRALKIKSDDLLANTLTETERETLKDGIVKEILRSFDTNGTKSKLANVFDKYSEKAKVWRDLYYEEKARKSAINNLLYEVEKIRNIHFGDFQNSTQAHNLLFRGSIERLSAIKHRGDLNKSGTRRIVADLNSWYNKENQVVGDRYVEDISYILSKIASGDGKLSAEEIRGLATTVAYFRHFIETNNKIYRAGKYVDAKPIVEEYIKKIADTQSLKVSWFAKLYDKFFNNQKHSYMQTFNDPMTVARYMDKYGDGFFTQTLESFREGAVKSAILEMELNASVEEFYDKHKKFLKNLKAKTVKYNNVEIPTDKALYLYMALNREQALMGLARSGFSYKDDKGKTVRVAGFETNEDLTLDDIKIIASEVQSELEKQFTEAEIEYIKIAEKLFNEDCKKLKSERDKTRLGYSNVVDDYYIPIRRAYIAQSVDVDSLQFELDRVSNLSFNKSAVKGAKNELFIESLDLVLSRHLRGIAQYYHLSNIIDNFNIIYNMDIGGNANRVKNIASESVNVWDKGKAYLQDLISDIQGINRGEGSRAFGFIRGSYAKYQLGANPKVWFTQLSSFFASTSILDYSSVIKGLAIKTGDVDKYCSLAKLRNNDNTAALAQGVLDKIDKVSNVLMKPIGMTDRLVVKKLFGACQVQVQKNTGLKIGTEENKIKAGELLQKVILETQQNTMATERSQAMRSSSELMKTLTMFTSDSMKVIGRVIDSYGELSILKARRKATTDASEKANLDKQIKTARKKAAKSTSALVTTAIFMALIAQAFRTLYNKDDEEDNIVENMTVDAVGNLFGGLPIFKDVYAKLVEGYDFDGYQYSAINDLLDSMSDVINLTGDIFSGNADSRDVALNIKKMSYAVGQLFGIPVRNVYNVFYCLTKRVSPETAYKIDDVFYKQSYSSDLKKAIKNNDEEMIATIAGLIMDENIGAFENGSTRNEVNRLLSAGFDVLPQAVGNSMTINEVQYMLTGPQKENFKKVYSQSITAVHKLVSSNGYKIATDEAKAKAIKYIYKYYYYEAQHQALNVDLDSKLYLFGQIVPIEKMALALAEVPLLVENSTNKKKTVQRYLQATKLTSAQKYMLMGYFGYKNTKGEGVVKSAINKTSLTKEQKKLLLQKCGY